MLTLAHLQILGLTKVITQSITLRAVEILQQACLRLTQGQYLDLAYEENNEVTIADYWSMVEGKTAGLISASTELGALTAFSEEQTIKPYSIFGRMLGLAFQVQDDLLGIWGNSSRTGKSNQSDLITRKKTLPILFGSSMNGKFAERWKQGPIQPDEIAEVIHWLENDGAKEFTQGQATILFNKALKYLDEARPRGKAGEDLKNLALTIVNRQA
jgi:geranylgeranyl diphosphate synthase type I